MNAAEGAIKLKDIRSHRDARNFFVIHLCLYFEGYKYLLDCRMLSEPLGN
jgi:hypothetical protein